MSNKVLLFKCGSLVGPEYQQVQVSILEGKDDQVNQMMIMAV